MTAVTRVMDDDVISQTLNRQRESLPEPAKTGVERGADAIARALKARIGVERYDLWFDRKTRLVLGGNTLFVEAVNGFAANWIRGKFAADLHAAAQEVLLHDVELCVRVADGVMDSPIGTGVAIVPRIEAVLSSAASQAAALNPKLTLEEFVIGASNQLAFHASTQVAAEPGKHFNPLFIHGHCGLGKTHLLQGICHRFGDLHPGRKWLYLTGEQFTNEFVEAIRFHKTDAFRKRIRGVDLLVIDDVHFLGNKKATQEEFLHTFNQVEAGGKQVVLASDCAPRQILSLSEQLSSRFVSGMVLRVDSPDLPTRLEILQRRVARHGWNISDPVLMHIAQMATSSVRELEGLLLQAVAGIRLINGAGGQARGVLATIRERTTMRGPVSAERIVEAVAEHFGLDREAVMGSGRERIVSTARAIAMHLCRQHTGMSYPEIGRSLGNKNHSTVIAACQRVEGLISAGELICWTMPEANGSRSVRHQAVSDVLHDLEAAIRRAT